MQEFKSQNISSVFNLQLPGEHPYCGDGLQQNKAFTYTPEELYEAGIYFYNLGWPDMHTPGISKMINLVQLMSFPIDRGEKIAVHCHAGYGRTGLAIACFLLYSLGISAEAAISMVRSKRKKCIQTSKQKAFVIEFCNCNTYTDLNYIRQLFPLQPLSLIEYYSNQTVLTHGNELKTIDNVPKIVYDVCKKIKERLENGEYYPEHITAAFYDPDKPVFTSPFYLSLLGITQIQELVISIDETCLHSPSMIGQQLDTKIKAHKVRFI